jgi:Cu-Zn family superoxide dismutase
LGETVRTRRTLLVVLAAALVGSTAGSAAVPTRYVLPGNAVFPEGVAFHDTTGNLFVGSTTDGAVFRGNVGQPDMQPFLAGGASGRTTAIGMKVDSQGRLFIAGGATGRVFVHDTSDGSLIRSFSTGFAGPQFLNDLVVTKGGDVFVTDSMRPVLYRIPAAAVRRASPGTLHAWRGFAGTPFAYTPGFNANGIVASPNGRHLLVAQSSTGKLFRIERPSRNVVEVALGEQQVAADGLWLQGQTLYAVHRPDIVKVQMSGDLLSGNVVSRTNDPSLRFPTTIAIARGRMLVVNSQFDKRGSAPELPFTVSSIRVP